MQKSNEKLDVFSNQMSGENIVGFLIQEIPRKMATRNFYQNALRSLT